jgi:hypothetical protein
MKLNDLSKFFFTISNQITMRMIPNEENINYLQNKIWYVIRAEENSGEILNSAQNSQIKNENDFFELKLNDIIKLGRVKYAVTELKIGDKIMAIDKQTENQVFELIQDYIKPPELNQEICKFCLQSTEEPDNPKVTLCRCTGTMLYVHYGCLKLWMITKLTNKENDKKTVYSYNMKSFNCEICKTPYPLRIKIDSKFYDLIACNRPKEPNYIVLESLNQLKENNNYKSIHVITLNENEKVILGRGHESDVRINDISVSRTHACLVLQNSKVYLKDLKSKFGTLSLVQNPLEVTDKKLSLQIGRTYVEMTNIANCEKKIKKRKRQ